MRLYLNVEEQTEFTKLMKLFERPVAVTFKRGNALAPDATCLNQIERDLRAGVRVDRGLVSPAAKYPLAQSSERMPLCACRVHIEVFRSH